MTDDELRKFCREWRASMGPRGGQKDETICGLNIGSDREAVLTVDQIEALLARAEAAEDALAERDATVVIASDKTSEARLLLDTGFVRMCETTEYKPETVLFILSLLDGALAALARVKGGAE